VAAIVGALTGWILIERFGRQWTIAAGTVLLGLASVAMGLLADLWSEGLPVQAYICAYLLIDVLVTIAFLALMMAICWQRVGATQYSLYMAIANMGLSAGAALLGPLHATFSYPHLFHVVAGCTVVVLFLVRRIDLDTHRQRVAELNEQHG
jgi:PAT family beta-lactamase induction signal transducer AmpG